MYTQYFNLTRLPFTISPDPSLIYPSQGHQEALAHLNYALSGHGGLVCLTGEVGTGKTTLSRLFLAEAGSEVRTAYVYNPRMTSLEMLRHICQELGVETDSAVSEGDLYRYLQDALLRFYANGDKVVCIVDEAQAMPVELLEQIRLLTNLETDSDKLMTLILVGQPELRDVLQRHDLRQLNQRITARYHLSSLTLAEVRDYVAYRLKCAGCQKTLFSDGAIKALYTLSGGIPRRINAIADRAMLGAYAKEAPEVSATIVRRAASEVIGETSSAATSWNGSTVLKTAAALALLVLVAVSVYLFPTKELVVNPVAELSAQQGYDYESCDQFTSQSEYHCLWVDMSARELQRLGLPYRVSVLDQKGQMGWKVNVDATDRENGKALVLWRGPSVYDGGVISPGSRHKAISWVRSVLGGGQEWTVISPANSTVSSISDFYDPMLAERVAEFQRANGLTDDKLLGPRTMLYLSLAGQ